jgi:hypothetical protein
MVAVDTIKVSSKTKKELINLKQHPRETMDDVISRLIQQEVKNV